MRAGLWRFFVPGLLLVITGLHMTLTWPLAKIGYAYAAIIFGEPSLVFGILLLVLSWHLWRTRLLRPTTYKIALIAKMLPQRLFIVSLGGVLLAIAVAGVTYRLFAASAAEPLMSLFANYSWIESWFISLLYAGISVFALLLPICLNEQLEGQLTTQVIKLAKVIGVIIVLFGIMNYFTHIGSIVHTQ
ncbi:DUF981 family protein [Brochothrix campestris]|uniref:Uncharacterized protein n=1 Tax=Brochothrix campestris FSL F6-1037 TaxID=1265861 RepID=W7CQL5_9LIST|nr:DUF981 family protein [Brochothrix campestris]EUJ39352.1 hypothetical protein BCAMP_07415 [Brochothrix campestris FSL F6-1037]